MATKTRVLFAAALAVAAMGPAQAWADSTLIIRPAGTAKSRNVDKVSKAVAKKAKTMEDVAISDFDVSPDCVFDLECLASAGRDAGVNVVVGVHVSRLGSDFAVVFIAVDAASGAEIARHEIKNIRRKVVGDMAGAALDEFLTTLPSQPAAAAPMEPTFDEPVAEPSKRVEPAMGSPAAETDPEPAETEPAVADVDASAAVTVPAYEDSDGDENDDAGAYAVELGLVTGIVLPQVSSELGTTAGIELDVGVPVWKSLSVVGGLGYSQPEVDSALSDPRITGEMYSTETTQRELMLTLGATWRFLAPASRLNAYGGLGPRVWLLETVTNGSAGGMDFGENQERSTRFGAAAWGGAEFLVGPGAVAAELDVGGSDLPHLVTGDVATTAVALQVGYRVRL